MSIIPVYPCQKHPMSCNLLPIVLSDQQFAFIGVFLQVILVISSTLK